LYGDCNILFQDWDERDETGLPPLGWFKTTDWQWDRSLNTGIYKQTELKFNGEEMYGKKK